MAQQDPVADRLRKAPLAPEVRAQVWDLYQQSKNEDDLAKALSSMSIPDVVKADLWDLKSSTSTPTVPQVSQVPQTPASATVVRGGPTPARGTQINLQRSQDFAQGLGAAIPFAGVETPNSGAGYAGRVVGEGALFALPVTKAAQALGKLIPTTAKAGQKFQRVMAAAKDVPLDVSEPGEVALRIYQLSERGGSMPKAVRDFLKRTTDPEKGPLNYAEARDFASNISRLSVNEFGRLTPAIAREIHKLRITLNKAVGQAASKAGRGQEYAAAMNEYARAMRARNAWEATVDAAKKWAIPAGAATVAGAYVTKVLRGGR